MTSVKERCVRGTRAMHQSTLTLGDPTQGFYYTTHAETFSGRGPDGQVRVFLARDPSSPSQHIGKLDLKNSPETQGQTHSRDVHSPKETIPHYVLHQVGKQNRKHNREGFVMKEVTCPAEATLYQSTYETVHCSAPSRPHTHEAGQPVHWHRHDIITGEEKAAVVRRRPRRQSGESILWAARRWETQYDSLRLY